MNIQSKLKTQVISSPNEVLNTPSQTSEWKGDTVVSNMVLKENNEHFFEIFEGQKKRFI